MSEVEKICEELVGYCHRYPGIQVAVIAGSDRWIKEVFIPALFGVVHEKNQEFKYHIKYQKLDFSKGSQLRWQVYEDPEMIKGWQAHVIWFVKDSYEGVDHRKLMAIEQAVHQRLRATKPGWTLRWIVGGFGDPSQKA